MESSNKPLATSSDSMTSVGKAPNVSSVRHLPKSTEATSTTALPASPPLVKPEHRLQDNIKGRNVSPHSLQKASSSPNRVQVNTLNTHSSIPTLSSLGSVHSPSHLPPMRRTSSTLASSSQAHDMRNITPIEELQLPPMTAAHIAHLFFQEDLKAHKTSANSHDAELGVILHDACYGHRYARPKTSKANLSTIVERPERIRATMMGLAAAYVRLGERHAEGRYPPQVQRLPNMPLPFTIAKSSRRIPLTAPVVTNVHGLKWMQELSTMCKDAESKLALNGKELVRPSTDSNGVPSPEKAKLHEGDLYLCSESLVALEGSLGAVCDAVDQVFSNTITKRTFVSIRPPGHHCSVDYPSGFCWINNVHVGISYAAQTHGLTHAVIVDFDLHHGDGSQAITWAHNAAAQRLPKNASASKKASIGYFSLHDINSYPCEFGDEEKVQNASLCIENAHGQTIWNTHLQPWKKESEFWDLYDTRYSALIKKARAFLLHHNMKRRQSASQALPKAAIFISAGFDASEWEGSGMQRHKVNVPTEFYARFTRDIVDLADEDGLGVDGRVVSVLEGGYSDRALTSGVLGHICGLAGHKRLETTDLESNNISHELATRLGKLKTEDAETQYNRSTAVSPALFDTNWWSSKCLEELEIEGKAPRLAVPATKQAYGITPAYTTPTQSSSAKAVSPLQPRRSMSASTAASLHVSASSTSSRPPTPPLPDVDWATAAQELCNLLIPDSRSTTSYRPEDLNAQATRIRKDRQSILIPVDEARTLDGKRMQLRDRKLKAPQPKDVGADTKAIAKSNRRKTIADATSLVVKPSEETGVLSPVAHAPTKVPIRRRSSVASSAIAAIEGRSPMTSSALYQSEVPQATEKTSTGSIMTQKESSPSNDNYQLVPKKMRQKPNTGPALTRPKKTMIERPPPVPRVSSSSIMRSPPQSAGPTSRNERDLPPQQSESAVNNDVDSLVSGIKRINLKLNPPKKIDQATPAETKKATAKALRKVAEIRTSKPRESHINGVDVPTLFHPDMRMPQQAQQASTFEGVSAEGNVNVPAVQAPLLESESPRFQTHIPHQPPTASDFTPSFMAPTTAAISALADRIENSTPFAKTNDKEADAVSPAMNPSAPLTTIVNNQVASPKHTKAELPVFTSTSPIVFAPSSQGPKSMNEMIRQDSEASHVGNMEASALDAKDAAFLVQATTKQST